MGLMRPPLMPALLTSTSNAPTLSAAAVTERVIGHVELNESGADRVGRLLAACLVACADPDLMAGGDELTSDLKAEPSVRSGDERGACA
jgi:hypothetical protein